MNEPNQFQPCFPIALDASRVQSEKPKLRNLSPEELDRIITNRKENEIRALVPTRPRYKSRKSPR